MRGPHIIYSSVMANGSLWHASLCHSSIEETSINTKVLTKPESWVIYGSWQQCCFALWYSSVYDTRTLMHSLTFLHSDLHKILTLQHTSVLRGVKIVVKVKVDCFWRLYCHREERWIPNTDPLFHIFRFKSTEYRFTTRPSSFLYDDRILTDVHLFFRMAENRFILWDSTVLHDDRRQKIYSFTFFCSWW